MQSDPKKTTWGKYFLEENLKGSDEREMVERMKGQGGASGEKTKSHSPKDDITSRSYSISSLAKQTKKHVYYSRM